jgi:hypothetical protein
MFRRSIFSALFSLVLFSALPAAAQNVSGDWNVYARTTHAGVLCVPQVGDEWWYDLSLTQIGNIVGGNAFRADTGAYFGPVNGTVVGGQFDFTIVETLVGQSTTHHFSTVVSPNVDNFGGTDDWTWTNGLLTCSGRDHVVAWRRERRFCKAETPSACPCGNHQAPGSIGGCKNSLGVGAVLHEAGFPSLSWGSYVLSVTAGRPNQPAMLLRGAGVIAIPFKDGQLCMGNPTLRLSVAMLDAAGAATFPDTIPGTQLPWTTAHHQVWYRDPGPGSPCGEGSNFSDALSVTWLP